MTTLQKVSTQTKVRMNVATTIAGVLWVLMCLPKAFWGTMRIVPRLTMWQSFLFKSLTNFGLSMAWTAYIMNRDPADGHDEDKAFGLVFYVAGNLALTIGATFWTLSCCASPRSVAVKRALKIVGNYMRTASAFVLLSANEDDTSSSCTAASLSVMLCCAELCIRSQLGSITEPRRDTVRWLCITKQKSI